MIRAATYAFMAYADRIPDQWKGDHSQVQYASVLGQKELNMCGIPTRGSINQCSFTKKLYNSQVYNI